jgi:hypothetical protein
MEKFNKKVFINLFVSDDYVEYVADNNDVLLIHKTGNIIKLVCDTDKPVKITSINVNMNTFYNSLVKTEVIPVLYKLFKNNETHYVTNEKGLALLHECIITYCETKSDKTFSTDFIYAYYMAYKSKTTGTYFNSIEDVTEKYITHIMTWDELLTYTINFSNETNCVYGFFDTYNKHYITMYDDYGNVSILEYNVIDNSKHNKYREPNDKVEIVADFAFITKIDAPQQLSDYLIAFEFLMNTPSIFKDLEISTFMNNVDKFEGENNVNHNGITKIAPLYTEVVFKQKVINHEIKLK